MTASSVVPRPVLPALVRQAAVVTLLGLVVGALTSVGQQAGLGPLADSVAGWTIPTAASVVLVRAGLRFAPVLGVLGFTADVLGYTLVSDLKGYPFDPTFWLLVGLVAGPVVGLAASALRAADRRVVAAGTGVLTGILAGEGVYGLTTIAATTGSAAWIALLALTGAGLAAMSIRVLRSASLILQALAVAAVTGAVFLVGYAVVLPAVLLA